MIHYVSHGERRNVVNMGEQMCLCILSISLFSLMKSWGFFLKKKNNKKKEENQPDLDYWYY